MLSIAAGDFDGVKLFVKTRSDAQQEASVGRFNAFPLLATVYSERNRLEIAQYLLELGSDVDQRTSDYGWSALQAACEFGLSPLARLLLASKANVNLTDHRGVSPLLNSVRLGNVEMVELLLSSKADANVAAAANGDTPLALYAASFNGHYQCARLLVKHGFDVNLSNGNNATPLIAASCKGHARICRLLISKNGADVLHTDYEGDCALDVVCASYDADKSCKEAIEALLNDALRCFQCNSAEKRRTLFPCTGCAGYRRYCGKQCQSLHWTAHHMHECHLVRQCDACGRPALPKSMKFSYGGCKSHFYCDEQCQQDDFHTHT